MAKTVSHRSDTVTLFSLMELHCYLYSKELPAVEMLRNIGRRRLKFTSRRKFESAQNVLTKPSFNMWRRPFLSERN